MSFDYTTYNDETDEERTYTIEYDYYGGCRGTRENGIQIEPDDEPDITITAVYDEDGNEVDADEVFTSDDLDEIYSKGFDDADSCIEDAKAEAQINASQARMEEGW